MQAVATAVLTQFPGASQARRQFLASSPGNRDDRNIPLHLNNLQSEHNAQVQV